MSGRVGVMNNSSNVPFRADLVLEYMMVNAVVKWMVLTSCIRYMYSTTVPPLHCVEAHPCYSIGQLQGYSNFLSGFQPGLVGAAILHAPSALLFCCVKQPLIAFTVLSATCEYYVPYTPLWIHGHQVTLWMRWHRYQQGLPCTQCYVLVQNLQWKWGTGTSRCLGWSHWLYIFV